MRRRPGGEPPGLRHISHIACATSFCMSLQRSRPLLPPAAIGDAGPEVWAREHSECGCTVEARTPRHTTVEPPMVCGHPYVAGTRRGNDRADIDGRRTHDDPSRHYLC